MDRRCGIIVLQAEADEFTLVGTLVLDTINEVRTTLNHTLVHELLEGLVLARVARVIEELVPETRIDQVTSSMLCSSNIEVDIAPVLISLTTHKGLFILGIHIAEVVGRTTSETRHRIQFEWEDGLVVNLILAYYLIKLCVPSPHLGATQWGFTRFRRLVFVDLRQFERQTLFWNHIGHIVLVVHRERLTPIALAGEDGITQTIVHLHSTQTLLCDELLRGSDSLLDGQTIE